jgi:uncharacterized membrane protein
MKSKAAIGNHPLHPMLVPFPIGAFFFVLVGDVAHFWSRDPFWYRFSSVGLGLGLSFALLAAAAGAVDYIGVPMSRKASGLAAWHALSIIVSVSLYAVSAVIRQGGAGLRTGRWWTAVGFSTLGFAVLGIAGWLGGALAHEERVGVADEPPGSALETEPEAEAGRARRFTASG